MFYSTHHYITTNSSFKISKPQFICPAFRCRSGEGYANKRLSVLGQRALAISMPHPGHCQGVAGAIGAFSGQG